MCIKRSSSISSIIGAAMVAVVLLAGAAPAQTQGSGTPEDPWLIGHPDSTGGAGSVTAVLDNGTLAISGAGAMANYEYNSRNDGSTAPWAISGIRIYSVIINDGVISIGSYAFYDCTVLTSLHIGAGLTSITNLPIARISLTSITVSEANTRYSAIGGVLFSKAQDTLFRYPIGKQGTSYTIPNSVTSIGLRAFNECTSLTSVTIPNSVISIGDYAFQTCRYLRQVIIPNSVNSIGNSAFSGCTGLTSVTIPDGVISIGNSAFSGCTGLTSVTIPDGVISIGRSAFSGCSNLRSVTIPNSVISIGANMFMACTSLTTVTIPNSVTSIEDSMFFNCRNLRSVTIPNSVTSIGHSAFSGCRNLTSISIHSSVTSIGDRAFFGCTGLTSVTSLRTTPPVVGENTFTNVPATACLYVSSEAYRTAQYWSRFTCIRAASGSYEIMFTLDGGTGTAPQNIIVVAGNSVTTMPSTNYRKGGYLNDGKWYRRSGTAPNYTYTEFEFGEDGTPVVANITLYLRWYEYSYVITGGGASYSVAIDTDTSVSVSWQGVANKPLQEILDSIRIHAGGLACNIQFGENGETLDIGSSFASISNANFTGNNRWGTVTLLGSITSSDAATNRGTVTLGGDVSVISNADIANTGGTGGSALYHNSTGTLTVSGGIISGGVGRGISNINSGTVEVIDNGTVSATTGTAIRNVGGGAVEIKGGVVSSGTGMAINNAGSGSVTVSSGDISSEFGDAIYNNQTGTVMVTGGSISAGAGHGYAIYNNTAATSLGGKPVITGRIGVNAGGLSLITTGTDQFSPGEYDLFMLDFSNITPNMIAVRNGVGRLSNFELYGRDDAILTVSGNNIVVASGGTAAVYSASVTGGSGGGSYEVGATVNIIATPAGNQTFLNWATTSPGVKIADANSEATTFIMPANNVTVAAVFETNISVLSSDRVIPVTPDEDASVVGALRATPLQFTAGPNPVSRDGGGVRFFVGATAGGTITTSGTLTIYDATGNVVRKIKINNANGGVTNVGNVPLVPRAIAEWDLRDGKGREVPAGTYLVRGAVMVNSRREKVSLILGVR